MMSLTGDQARSRTGPASPCLTSSPACTPPSAFWGLCTTRTRPGEGPVGGAEPADLGSVRMVNQSAAYVTGGVVPTRMGNEHPSMYPYAPMQTGDGNIIIATGNDGQFVRLCAALAIPDVAADAEFSPPHCSAMRTGMNSGRSFTPCWQRSPPRSGFSQLSDAGCRAPRSRTCAGGVDFAERLGLQPVVLAGSGTRRIPHGPAPRGVLPHPRRLPAPALQSSTKAPSWSATGCSGRKPWPMPEPYRTRISRAGRTRTSTAT